MKATQLYYTIFKEHEDEYLTGWKTVALYVIKDGKLQNVETFELENDDDSEEVVKEYCSKYYKKYKVEWI